MKTKILVLSMLLMSAISSFSFQRDADDYCLINNLDDLLAYRDSVNRGTLLNGRLTADIDLSAVCGIIDGDTISWTSIHAPGCSFDGGNHTVSNLYGVKKCWGFFREVKSVRNLILKHVYLEYVFGALCDMATDLIENCHVEGYVKGNEIFGECRYTTIINCSNYAILTSQTPAVFYGSNCQNCYNRGEVIGVMAANAFSVGSMWNVYNSGRLSGDEIYPMTGIINVETPLSNVFNLDIEVDCQYYRSNSKTIDSSFILSGKLTDTLNSFVEEHNGVENVRTPYLMYEQDEEGFPRFVGLDLRPTKRYFIKFIGDYEESVSTLIGTCALPVCPDTSYKYVFENDFDGMNIVSDTVVRVSKVLLEETPDPDPRFDADGYFLINNLEDLLTYRDSVNGGALLNGRLTADIDLSPVCGIIDGDTISWISIHAPGCSFDGGNHTVSNLYGVKSSGEFFKEVGNVRNLTLKHVYLCGVSGVLCDMATDTIENCHVEGYVEGNTIFGNSRQTTIVNCSNYATLTSESPTVFMGSNCYNCYNRGKVVGSADVCVIDMDDMGNVYNSAYLLGANINPMKTLSDSLSLTNVFNLDNNVDPELNKDQFPIPIDSAFILSGKLADTLNSFVEEHNSTENVEIPYLMYEQDEEGFPRFVGLDLLPTICYFVNFVGDYEDCVSTLDGTCLLPVCPDFSYTYVFENGFNGRNIVSDTLVRVTKNPVIDSMNYNPTLSESERVLHDGISLYVDDGTLFIQSPRPGRTVIFGMKGRAIACVRYSEGVTAVDGLPKGVYVVEDVKVVIR